MQEISFQDLPQKYTEALNEIFNDNDKKKNTLKKLYSNFSFKYLNFTLTCANSDMKASTASLGHYLFQFGFMTYFLMNQISHHQIIKLF